MSLSMALSLPIGREACPAVPVARSVVPMPPLQPMSTVGRAPVQPSPMMQASARKRPASASLRAPSMPPTSSSQVNQNSTVGPSLSPSSCRRPAATMAAASPPFMSVVPRPKTRSPTMAPLKGWRSQASAFPGGTTSMWPSQIRRPSPRPGTVAQRLGLPATGSWTAVSMPRARKCSSIAATMSVVRPGGFTVGSRTRREVRAASSSPSFSIRDSTPSSSSDIEPPIPDSATPRRASAHSPTNRGSRFSTKAVEASLWSALWRP